MSEGGTIDALSDYLDTLMRDDASAERIHRTGPNPYQGLRFFDERASVLLTTREGTSSQIRKRFTTEHCVFVIGGSGCGKSSLVRGKILDELRNFSRPIEGRDGDWETCSFRPETEPVEQFVDAFWNQVVASAYKPVDRDRYDLDDPVDADAYAQAEAARAEIRREIGTGDDAEAAREMISLDLSMSGTGTNKLHDGFANAYRWVDKINEIQTGARRSAPANLMIIVDQFEELFRNRVDQNEAQALCAMIRHAYTVTNRQDGVYVAISMRSEDVHRCAEIEGLADIVNSSVVLVDWLNPEDLHKAIVDPPRKVLESWGVPMQRFGTGRGATTPYAPEVVKQIIDEVTWLARSLEHKSDHLPLLQHGLHELWATAAERWGEAHDAGKLERISIEMEDLIRTRKQCGLRENSFWLQAQLRKSAHLCYVEARKAYKAEFTESKPPVAAAVALRAALCEMASRDENGKVHRDFAVVSGVVRERLLPKENDATIAQQRNSVSSALRVALKVFAKRQLLVELGSKSEPAYDVTHEALIRNWPQMRRWVDEDSELLGAYLESVNEVDHRPPDQKVTYKIDQQYVPVLGPTCDWSWSRRIFRSPGLAKVWGWLWPGERQRYGESVSRRWLVRALDERRTGREGSDGRATRSVPASQIVRGVRRRWRRDLTRSMMKRGGVGVALLSIAGLTFWGLEAKQETAALEEQRNSLVSMMLVSNPALDRAPHYNKLDEIRKGLNPKFGDSKISNSDLAKRMNFVVGVETTRNALDRIGRIAQATTVDLFEGTIDTKEISSGNDAPGADYRKSPACASFGGGGTIEPKSKAFAISIGGGSQQSDELAIRFQRSASDHAPLAPISASTRNRITGNSVRVPSNAQKLCLSPDGRVAALTIKGQPAPRLYALDAIRNFDDPDLVIGVSIMELQANWYPELGEHREGIQIRAMGFDDSPNGFQTRSVYFAHETDENQQPNFVAYFADGITIPSPDESGPVSKEVASSNDREEWTKIEKVTPFKCSGSEEYSWSFSAPPVDIERAYVTKEVAWGNIGIVNIVITSNVRKEADELDRFIVFNVDMHHELWGCRPLLLTSFVSSPTSLVKIISETGGDGKNDGEMSLYLRDVNSDSWRRITLLQGFDNVAELVKRYMAKYNDEEYEQQDSSYSRLSAVFGVEQESVNDDKAQ